MFSRRHLGTFDQRLRGPSIEVVHTRAFAATPDGGNPRPVIPAADGLNDTNMLDLARRFNLDTAFIVKAKSPDVDMALRYFVPDHEMEISGHATIAAMTVAQEKGIISLLSTRVQTASGVFSVQCQLDDGRLTVQVDQRPPVFGSIHQMGEVASALNLHEGDFDVASSPIQSVSVSRAKLLIPVRDSRSLDKIKPDFEELWRLCESFEVSGFYPFTRLTSRGHTNLEARQFPYRAGFLEDAATGVAASALAAYLTLYDERCRNGWHTFRIAQGYAMGAPSMIEASALCAEHRIVRTFIRGSAVIVRHEQIGL